MIAKDNHEANGRQIARRQPVFLGFRGDSLRDRHHCDSPKVSGRVQLRSEGSTHG